VWLVLPEYVIVGGGDFAIEVATYLKDIWRGDPAKVATVTDIVATGRVRLNDFVRVLGSPPALHETFDTVDHLTQKVCVIAVGDPSLRYRFMQALLAIGGRFGSVVHPTAYVASTAVIGDGAIICPMAFVGPFAKIGANCAINVHAIVGHDVVVGDCAVLSPGSDINGHGGIGEGAFLGAGAVVSPKAALGAFGKLSAGSVLNRTTDEGFLMHGNPAAGRQMFRRP
jgi:sugar O-acyltransferase (sialic acid O-acetyltransferase NeuD family)